jgi:hypothetical protein
MSSSEHDQQTTELLKGIAASLKGIHASLESLTAAVEDVSETIEKAHEPEGDLGVHLVGALKDLVSALHKKAGHERNFQPQQNQQRHQQLSRRDQQGSRRQDSGDSHETPSGESNPDEVPRNEGETPENSGELENRSAPETQNTTQGGNKRRRPRGRRSGKTPADQG